jgi:outer membrane receptor protein involved in Fe transport
MIEKKARRCAAHGRVHGLALLLVAHAAGAQEPVGTLPTLTVSEKKTLSTATRMEADALRLPFATTVVDRAEMDAVGAVTLEDTMRSVPGLQFGTQGNYYTRFETRGLRDTQDVLVLVDGVPLRLLQGNSDVTLIAPDLVDRIEFIKGPASALYGRNAIGGVAQFFLKPERAGGEVTTTLGSFGRTDASGRYRWDLERGNLYLGLASNHYDGFQRGAGRSQEAVVLGGDFGVTDRWTTGFQLHDSRVRADRGSIVPLQGGRPMFGITARDNYGIPGSHVTGDYQSVAWKNRVDFGGGWSLDHLSSFARYDRLFAGGITIVPPPAAVTKGYSETDTADRGAFHDLALTHLGAGRGWVNELRLGVNLERAWQDQDSPTFMNAPTYRGPNYDVPVTNVRNDPRGIRGASTASRFDQEVRSVYLQDRFEWGDVGVTAGLRHDRFEQSLGRSNTAVVSTQEASRTSPRVGVDWAFAKAGGATHAAFANWTEGFRPQAVALNTRGGVVVPDILRPELTRSKEAGVKGRAADEAWTYQASLFQAEKVDGQRAYRNGPDSFVFSNATLRVHGLETQLQWRLSPRWTGYAHYTWQDAKLRDFQTYTDAGAPSTNFGGLRVRMSARHIAGAGVTYRDGRWSATATASYVGTRFLRDNVVDPQKLPGYLLANVAVGYQATRALTLQAGVNNLGDRYYIGDDLSAQEAGNAGAPRTFFARARYAF